MKLVEVHVREFKSIWDSGPLKVDSSTTCLVGKNEAGKTALLEAIYRLNPIIAADSNFDVTDDYPRSAVEDYTQEVETKRRKHANVIEATFRLDPPEIALVSAQFGAKALSRAEVVCSKGYSKNTDKATSFYVTVPVDEAAIVEHLIGSFQLPDELKAEVTKFKAFAPLSTHLIESGKRQDLASKAAIAEAAQLTDEAEKAAALGKAKSLAESEQAKGLRTRLTELLSHDNLGHHIWNTLLVGTFPKFLYFDDYYQMKGHDNIQALKARQLQGKLESSDYPMLGLLELARLDLDKLLSATRTQELKNKLEGASNHLSGQILKYWSQNKHLRMKFDIRQALADDPPGMQSGVNVWGEVYDSKHLVSTALGTRSTGFVWFFSFLAWYSSVKKKGEPLILLLDEPGLSLHGKAQEDLLRYFEVEIVSNPNHQLIYSTHSPFMVDPSHFERVRIVQDASIDSDEDLPRDKDGTKVLTNVLDAGADSLFPLQGALATRFIRPCS